MCTYSCLDTHGHTCVYMVIISCTAVMFVSLCARSVWLVSGFRTLIKEQQSSKCPLIFQTFNFPLNLKWNIYFVHGLRMYSGARSLLEREGGLCSLVIQFHLRPTTWGLASHLLSQELGNEGQLISLWDLKVWGQLKAEGSCSAQEFQGKRPLPCSVVSKQVELVNNCWLNV